MIESQSNNRSKEKATIESASEIYNVMQESAGQKMSFYKRMQMTNGGNNYQQSLNSQNQSGS